MKCRFNFNLEAWIDMVEIEADSEDDAREKLYQMSLSDILDAGGYEKNISITQVDTEITEIKYIVKTRQINYDVGPEDVENSEEYIKRVTSLNPKDPNFEDKVEEIYDEVRLSIIESLPQELTLEIECEENDLDDYVADEITLKTDWLVNSVEYDIIIKK